MPPEPGRNTDPGDAPGRADRILDGRPRSSRGERLRALRIREAATEGLPTPFTGPGMCPCCSEYGTGGVCENEDCTNFEGAVNDEY